MMSSLLRFIWGVLLFFLALNCYARTILKVNDQSSFDGLQQSINHTIKSGEKDIYVYFSQGKYIAKENHLFFDRVNAPDLNLRIIGNGAILLPEGKEYCNGDSYEGNGDPNNCWMSGSNEVQTWSDVCFADGLIEIIDEKENLCRIKSKEALVSFGIGATHILIPHWFQSSVYRIERIVGNYVYFIATDLKISYKNGYNVNDDYNFGKKGIRFKLLNAKGSLDCLRVIDGKVYLPSGVSSVREGEVHRFFSFLKCSFHSIEISGIKFWGNSFGNSASAIYFNDVNNNKIWLHGCEFRGMHGIIISIATTPNVCVENNLFTNCYYHGIQADNNSKNTIVKDNSFFNMGKRMQNSFCIICRGENYIITGNKMIDFGYGGIGVGVQYKGIKKSPSSGIVDNNEMSYTESYCSNSSNYGIMDSGAIYLSTKNDLVIIRNNFIHNYSGAYGNRGIFCDDGAYNYQIYGNIITNIENSYCIASRREPNVEISKTPESGIVKANVNNVIRDNIVDGEILFAGHEDMKNGCVKGANYILMKKGENAPKNTIKNIVDTEEDIPIEFVGLANGKIYISSQSYRKLKKSKSWKNLRKYVGKY